MAGNMRGLTMFIMDIRNANNKEQENMRVEKELAHIRKQFADKKIDGYNLRKYVWKLLYIQLLGYDVNIGHMEALRLITSTKHSEKIAGYIACTMLFNESSELLKMLVQIVRKDLNPINDNEGAEISLCMALAFVANVGGKEFADDLAGDIQKVLFLTVDLSSEKKAALALLRLYRRDPTCINMTGFPAQLMALMDDPNLGVVMSVMSLMIGIIARSTAEFEEAPSKAIELLAKIVFSNERKSIYRYYLTLCPWLQVKLLRLLQYFPTPATDSNVYFLLKHVITEIFSKTTLTKNPNKNNADHSILFEAINVVIHMCMNGQTELQASAVDLLACFISIPVPNFRYLAIETMTRFAAIPDTFETLRSHIDVIEESLHDPDVSIRKRALDLLFMLCHADNATTVVSVLLEFLPSADFELREELVLKIAVLAERFVPDLKWYIDVILRAITLAGDFITDDIWYRVVQIVTNNEQLQDYAATSAYKLLQLPTLHENGVKIGAYLLGEFSDQISDSSISGSKLFSLLLPYFRITSDHTKALLLTAVSKLANTYPEIKGNVAALLDTYRTNVNVELQQRACEYLALQADKHLIETVFDVMPNYPQHEGLLSKHMKRLVRIETDQQGDHDEEQDTDDESVESDADESASVQHVTSSSNHKEDIVSAPAATVDLLGFGDYLAQEPQVTFFKESIQPVANGASDGAHFDFPKQDLSSFVSFYGQDEGVLYSSSSLQVSFKASKPAASELVLSLSYGNQSLYNFENASLAFDDTDQGALDIVVQPDGLFSVFANQTTTQTLHVRCLKPFMHPIVALLTFSVGGHSHELSLTLPLTLGTFILPVRMEAKQFVPAWLKYSIECIGVRRLAQLLELKDFERIVVVSLNMAIINYVENVPSNFVAAGSFQTSTPDTVKGGFVSVPCMLRIETKPGSQAFRVTVHSAHAGVSAALLNAVTQVFNAAE